MDEKTSESSETHHSLDQAYRRHSIFSEAQFYADLILKKKKIKALISSRIKRGRKTQAARKGSFVEAAATGFSRAKARAEEC